MPTPPYTGGVLPGAEPIDLPGGPVGALLCHGFTGTTQSMRPWAEHLAAAGLTVTAPRLPGPRHPLAGHEPHPLRRLVRRARARLRRPARRAARASS